MKIPSTCLLLAVAWPLVLSEEEPKAPDPAPKAPDGKTRAVEPTEAPKTPYRILERKKLSDYERKKIEKERADRIRNAERAQKARLAEYEGVDWANRHKIRTPHFDVQCNSTRRVAELYGRMMELIRAKLAEMFPSKIQRNLRAPLFIYKSQEDFMDREGLARFAGRGLGGWYNPASQSITTYHGTFGFTGTTFSVLCHEGTHYYQGLVLKDFQNLPRWFHEGMAVYFGDGSTFDPKTTRIEVGKIPRDRLAHIQEKMLQKTHTPIEKLIALPPGGFSGSHYADAWALIYFLAKGAEKGEKLLQAYWTIGLEERLTKRHFLDLAQKLFGSIENLETQYVEYILGLEMPSAGKVAGDYFVSDIFQFDFKAPGEEWQFFEDPTDKSLLVGVLLPGTSAEIRVYYDNNIENDESGPYLQKYLKSLERRAQDLKHEKVKISNLDGHKLTYLEGAAPPAKDPAKDGKKDAAKEAPKVDPRRVVKFLLVQVDGVVTVKCLAAAAEAERFTGLFEKANDLFSVSLTRRW